MRLRPVGMKDRLLVARQLPYTTRVFGVLWCALVWGHPVWAQSYGASWEESQWRVKSGAFSCLLNHDIPGFGEAQLSNKTAVGEVLELRGTTHKGFPVGSVSYSAQPPAWRGDLAPISLGRVQQEGAGRSLRLTGQGVTPVLDQLKQGQGVMFTGASSDGGQSLLRVSLSPRNFPKAYDAYRQCTGQLIPYTFAQIARITLHYQRDASQLSNKAKGELDKVARYSLADKNVLGVIVDAHSDKRDEAEQSMDASRTQAELVSQYLIAKGMNVAQITSRWHGDKYPAASNATEQGRAQNRRVTVRLENADTRQVMEKRVQALRTQEQARQDAEAAELKAREDRLAQQQAQRQAAGAALQKTDEGVLDKPRDALTLKELERMVESQDLRSGKQPKP